ncbi:MAG: hypothetical protein AAGA56_25640 [Myxococcota bacterium]
MRSNHRAANTNPQDIDQAEELAMLYRAHRLLAQALRGLDP